MTDIPADTSGLVSAPESVPGFTAVTVAALQGAGRLVQTDWEQETFDVLPLSDGGPRVSGVILHSTHAVAFYAVWDDFVPSAARTAVAEWSVRANTDLSTCAIEFSLDTGILAVRSVVRVGPLSIGTPGEDIPEEAPAISRAAYGALLTTAVDDAAAAFVRFQQPVADIVASAG
jgi:hypothetical protein